MIKKNDFKDILVRRPFFRVQPDNYMVHRSVYETNVAEPIDKVRKQIVTQADFLREYYPTGHKINSTIYYPDVLKQDPDTKKWYLQPIMRTAFAFQQIFATKQIVHLTGNDMQFELSQDSENAKLEEKNVRLLNLLRLGWLESGMEVRFYEAVRSVKITGDTAMVGFFEDGKFKTKSLSYLNGDVLYPHFNSDGELYMFARDYTDFDENGNAVTDWVEVWDNKYMYRARKNIAEKSFIEKIKDTFGLSGYELIEEPKEHGFPFVPVAYHRDEEGACWSAAQQTIETYEESFSYLCESNRAYALPIMFLKGEGIEVVGDMNGAVKRIDMESGDSEAGFLNHPDVSSAYKAQLDMLYRLMYEQAFTVQPPELKSGDLPGVALKLLYSPAIELAIHDSQKWQPFIEKMLLILKHGYGKQVGLEASLVNLKVNAWIKPYIHLNESELVTNLATAVQNNFISHQTASERIPQYSKTGEYDRIMREMKEKQQLEIITAIKKMEAQTDERVREEEEKNKIAKGNSGQDVNTGHGEGGRPNRTGKTWDENGNEPNENNWDNWDKTH